MKKYLKEEETLKKVASYVMRQVLAIITVISGENPLQNFFQLKKYGHIIVSNLHADNLQQAKNQICYENPIPEELFYLVDLYIFLKVEGHRWNYKRKIDTIWVKEGNGLKKFNETEYKAKEKYLFFIQKTVSDNIFLIQDFRKEFLKTFYSDE